MAAFFDNGRSRRREIDEDVVLNIIGSGDISDIEGFSSGEEDNICSNEVQPLQSPSTSKTTAQKKKSKKRAAKTSKRAAKSSKKRKRIWKIDSFQSKDHVNSPMPVPKKVSTPLEYFTEYFPEEFFQRASDCTNMYHLRRTGKVLNCTPEELKKFVGIHLVMGCIPYPRLPMYWRANVQLHMITTVMSRDRFITLRNAFHVVDTDEAPPGNNNPLWKVQPMIDSVKAACRKIERVPGKFSIDEQMIPFTGRCAIRQVVKNKPRPVGLKNFVLTTSQGLMLDFEIYRGANSTFGREDVGLGPSVILHLAKNVPQNSCLYFDRFFTTIPLLEKLEKRGFHGTGTIMLNRIAERKLLNIKSDKDMKRGDILEYVCGNIVFVKWMDNKGIFLASNCTGAGAVASVSRWNKKNKVYVEITAPEIVTSYNRYMGGVDVLDQLLEYYRTFIKTRKWTLKVIIHFFDLAVANSWRQFKNDGIALGAPSKKTDDLLKFRLDLVEALLSTPKKKRTLTADDDNEEQDENLHSKRYKPATTPAADKRYDGYDHLPIFDDIASPRCCRNPTCGSRCKIRCTKCNVYLCISRGKNCFNKYHTKS